MDFAELYKKKKAEEEQQAKASTSKQDENQGGTDFAALYRQKKAEESAGSQDRVKSRANQAVNALTAGLGKVRGGMFNGQAPATPAVPVPAAQTPAQSVYEQRKAAQQAAGQELKSSWWDYLGTALANNQQVQAGQMLSAEQGRQMMDAANRLGSAMQQSREANKVIDWEGRDELLKEYRRLDKIDNPQARQQAQAVREQLRQGDVKAGNLAEGGDMAYNFGDWTSRIVPGAVKNTAAGGYNALLTAGDLYAKSQAMQGPTENELITEWITGQAPGSTAQMRREGYESEEYHQFMQNRYAEASAIKASAQRDLQIAKENQRPVVQAGVDIGENIIEMGADAAIAHLTGGSSLIPMAVRVFGSGAMDSREQGYSLEQQAAYGAAQAAIEVFTEKIGGIGGRGKGWSDALADKLVDELAQSPMGKNALRFLIAMAEEGGEEVLSDFMQPLANYAAGMKWDGYNAEEMLYDFFIGSVVGGMSSVKSMTGGQQRAEGQDFSTSLAEQGTSHASRASGRSAQDDNGGTEERSDQGIAPYAETEDTQPEAAQEAAGAPQTAQGEITQQSAQETPQEPSARLNQQEGAARPYTAADALAGESPRGQSGAASEGTTLPPAEQAPSLPQGGQSGAQTQAPAAEAREEQKPAPPKKDTVTNATKKLQEKYGTGLRLQETRGRVQSLAARARETDAGDPGQVRSLWESAKQQAREILRTTENPGARTEGDTGGEIRSYLRGQKIRIDERLRSDRPSEYESLQELLRKNFGTLNFSNTEGRTLDQVYQELGYMFGEGMFPQNVGSHAEIVERILGAVANERGKGYTYEQSLSDEEYEHAVAELTMELMQAAESVTGQSIPTPVRETQPSLTPEQAREAAIESELEADFEGELSREDAERIVDQRFEDYGEYDLDKILNGMEDTYGEAGEQTEEFDEYAYWAERFHAAEADGAVEGADAGSETQLSEAVGQGTPAGGPAEAEPGGAGEVRGPGSAAPAGEVSGETEERSDQGIAPYAETEGRSDQGIAPYGDGEAGAQAPGQKRSKTESHTLQHIAERLGGEQEELYYIPISERQSLGNAINRVNAGMDGEMQKLLDKELWTGEDFDTAFTIQGLLQVDGVRTGDFSAAQAWGRAVQARGTRSGQALQAISKWTRSGAAAAAEAAEQLGEVENLSEETRARITNDVYGFAADFDGIEDGDLGGIRELIKRQARYRNTWTFGKKGFDRYLNEIEDFDYLREYALRQMMNIPSDYTEQATLAQKVKTWQVNSMLMRLGTFFRNFGGNGVFGVQDTISQDAFGVALDALIGRATGRRTVGFDRGWLSSQARKGARQGLVRSILEVAGDVDMMGGGSRYGTNANRTFKMTGNAFERFMSRWEQLLGYSLTSSDRFFRGGIEAEQQRGLERFENLTEQERQEARENMADYRLFQNQDLAYSFSKGAHDVLNVAGFGGELRPGQTGRQGGFGLGDFVNPYPGVPANLWAKPFEYSPANVAKGAVQLVKLLSDVHNGNEISVKRQQNAVMNVARGLHGSALFVALAAMFKAGLFKNADDEEDLDAKALANAEGRQGVQINLTAAKRWLEGKGSADWQKGDKLMKIDWLEPMNAFLSIASLAADDFDDPGALVKDYAEGSFQAMMDMPVMQNLAGIFDTYNYSKADTTGGKILDTAVGFGTDALTGMLPAPISQTARALDPYYRETVGENATDTARRRVMNAIPGVRELLPEKLDNFGRPKRQANSAFDRWMNSFVRPGQITDYKAEDVDRALDEFAARTGEAVYPKRKAPNSFTADKEKIILSGEEKQAYQKAYGEAAQQYYGEILLGEDHKDLSDGEKQWLLDEAEGYATYQARKAILEARGENYKNDSWDKMDALETKGGNPFDYLLTKQSLKNATDSKDYTAVDALLGNMKDLDKATKEQLFDDVSRLDDREAAYRAGIDTETWEKVYQKYKYFDQSKSMSKTEQAIAFARWLNQQPGLNRRQENLLREQMGYYITMRAKTDTFDKLASSGLSTEHAASLWNGIQNIQPTEGHTSRTQNQEILYISAMRELSEAEKWAALDIYASDSCYKKAMEAKAKGKSFDEWSREYTKG